MSPRNRRQDQDHDTAERPEHAAVQGFDDVAVSITGDRDHLAVHARGTPASPARCVVVASRAYGRRLCRKLRAAQIAAEPVAWEELAALAAPNQELVVVIEAGGTDRPPALQSEGVFTVGLIEESDAAAHVAALQAGWDAVADRAAPLDVIVEVVWEAAHGRTLLRSDVAHQLVVGRPRSGAATPAVWSAKPAVPPSAEPAGEGSSRPEHVAHAEIELRAEELASAGNGLGEPRTALAPVPATDAWQQMFDNAWVLWRPSTGVCVLCRGGAIATRYAELGGPTGYLGCPLGDEETAGAGAFCRFELPGSTIVWHPDYGVHETRGTIGEYWLDTLGGPAGPWGYPISDEYDSGGGVRAVDFEGGTLVRRQDRGVGEIPRQQEFEIDRWLTLLPDPPRRPGGSSRAAIVGIREADEDGGGCSLFYTAVTAGAIARVHDPAVAGASRQIERARAVVPPISGEEEPPGLLRTSVDAAEVLALNGTTLPLGLTAEHLHAAELDLWRDIWDGGPDLSTVTASRGAKLTWAGFAADGHLEYLLDTLFSRSPDARSVFLQVGIGVEVTDGRRSLVVADTEQGWLLHGDDAERYIRCDPRLLAVFRAVLHGTVPADLLGGDTDAAPARNEALRQAALDAQFLTVVAHAGRLPGWSLLPPWTRELRAAVTHNLHLGCLTGWDAYESTAGDPVEVVRAMVTDFFCGPAVLLAQSHVRFEGPAGHGALAEAAASFPAAVDHDDPHACFIVAGGQRRRVDPPA